MNTINKKISNLKHLEYLNNFEILGKNLLELNKKNPTSQINDMMEALNGIGIYVSGIYDNDLFYPKIISELLLDKNRAIERARKCEESILELEKENKKLKSLSNL